MKATRRNLTTSDERWAAFQEQARREYGGNLSAYADACMEANLDKDLSDKLPPRTERGRPKGKE